MDDRKEEEESSDEEESADDDESEGGDSSSSDEVAKSKRTTPTPKPVDKMEVDSSSEDDEDIESPKSPKRKQKSRERSAKQQSVGKGKRAPGSTNALSALAKKFDDDEQHCLAVQLISCSKVSGKNKKRTRRGSSPFVAGIESITLDFLKSQKGNIHSTEVELLNFVFHCVGGGPSHIQSDINIEDDISEEAWGDIVDEVTDHMEYCPQEKVLISASRKLPLALSEYEKIYEQFWLVLTKMIMENTAKWGVDWITSITKRLVEVSGIGVADLRHAITSAIYHIGQALLECANEIQKKTETAKRQLKASKSSQGQRKAHLRDQIKEWEETSEAAVEIVGSTIMTAVFPHRYRDARPSIRVASLAALGKYCVIAPEVYLQSMYLKYVGWMLFDREADVRRAALTSLLGPFQAPSIDVSGMEAVISKYLRRLVEICTSDIDQSVQEVAMEFLLHLLQRDLFDVAEDDNLWDEINLSPLKGTASGKYRRDGLSFVMEQLTAFDDGPHTSESVAADQIAQLAQWYGYV